MSLLIDAAQLDTRVVELVILVNPHHIAPSVLFHKISVNAL
jgi:hypothetical protein